jgi:hypothetical protein
LVSSSAALFFPGCDRKHRSLITAFNIQQLDYIKT